MKKTVICMISLIVLIGVVVGVLVITGCSKEEPKEPSVEKFAASDTTEVPVFEITENDKGETEVKEVSKLVRGSSVNIFPTPVAVEEVNYVQIEEPQPEDAEEEIPSHYLLETSLADTKEGTVLEKQCFVRTPVTVYKTADAPDIASFFPKGTPLSISGFSGLKEDGTVEMYQVSDGKNDGFVYSKYLVSTQEEADAVNTEYHNLNKDKIYESELYCGLPGNLDYFPYDKTFATDKKLPEEARTLYVGYGAIDYIEDYIDCAKDIGSNALVIDIKDGGLAYHSEVAKEYCPTAFKSSFHDVDSYRKGVQKVKDAGIWTIGRIVVFNDEDFAKDHPEECIYDNGVNQEWPTAYSRLAWEYNVKLAQEAVKEMGFDEIQFDYVRFPEDTFFMSRDGNADFKNKYNEEKSQAIQNFCFYATDQVHKAGAYFSVDVFGECSNGYVTAYGQYWPAISMIVDAISSMPYVDHFGRDVDTWTDYYTTVFNWAEKAKKAQDITVNPASARTWLTCYDVPYWDPVITADSAFLGGQVQALWDAGIGEGGFITWNAASSIATYRNVGDAFRRDYTKKDK